MSTQQSEPLVEKKMPITMLLTLTVSRLAHVVDVKTAFEKVLALHFRGRLSAADQPACTCIAAR